MILLPELRIVTWMVHYFCKKKHHNKGLCSNCSALLEYAESRINNCPIKDKKTVCSNCKIHCYRPEMRQKIKDVMRFSGPRLLLFKPVWGFEYLIKKLIAKN